MSRGPSAAAPSRCPNVVRHLQGRPVVLVQGFVNMNYTQTMDDTLDQIGVFHFKAEEFARKDEPPAGLWPHIVLTAQAAERIRVEFGGPVVVVSGYRSPAMNRAAGGAKASQHLQFRALDLKPANVRSVIEFNRFVKICQSVIADLKANGLITGIGIYDGESKDRSLDRRFVHIDVGRPGDSGGRERSAKWKG